MCKGKPGSIAEALGNEDLMAWLWKQPGVLSVGEGDCEGKPCVSITHQGLSREARDEIERKLGVPVAYEAGVSPRLLGGADA